MDGRREGGRDRGGRRDGGRRDRGGRKDRGGDRDRGGGGRGRDRGGGRGRDRGGGRGRDRGGGRGRDRGGGGRTRAIISNEIRATIIHHVLVHGMSMREAGLRVQPNISRFSVASIVRTFREENR